MTAAIIVFKMMYPHHNLSQNPNLTQTLAEPKPNAVSKNQIL